MSNKSISEKNKKANENLKIFRSNVAKLKKSGLLSKKYDARSATPTKYLNSQISRFKGVIEGTAKTAKLPKQNLEAYKDTGYDIKNGRVVVPVTPGEKLNVSHGKISIKRTMTDASGNGYTITRVIFPVPFRNLHQYLEDIGKNEKFDSMLGEGQYFAFKLYGNNSHQLYGSVELMIEELSKYNSVVDDKLIPGGYEERDIYQNLEFWKLEKSNRKEWDAPREARKEEYYREQRRLAAQRRRANEDKLSSEELALKRKKSAERSRQYRERKSRK